MNKIITRYVGFVIWSACKINIYGQSAFPGIMIMIKIKWLLAVNLANAGLSTHVSHHSHCDKSVPLRDTSWVTFVCVIHHTIAMKRFHIATANLVHEYPYCSFRKFESSRQVKLYMWNNFIPVCWPICECCTLRDCFGNSGTSVEGYGYVIYPLHP